MRVLVVEDEASLSEQLSAALSAAGYAVDCAADGERADLLARTEGYDEPADECPQCQLARAEAVLVRGVRADEAAPGSGLGLAIVRDLAEIYGGSVYLETSPLGGLRARLRFPS